MSEKACLVRIHCGFALCRDVGWIVDLYALQLLPDLRTYGRLLLLSTRLLHLLSMLRHLLVALLRHVHALGHTTWATVLRAGSRSATHGRLTTSADLLHDLNTGSADLLFGFVIVVAALWC